MHYAFLHIDPRDFFSPTIRTYTRTPSIQQIWHGLSLSGSISVYRAIVAKDQILLAHKCPVSSLLSIFQCSPQGRLPPSLNCFWSLLPLEVQISACVNQGRYAGPLVTTGILSTLRLAAHWRRYTQWRLLVTILHSTRPSVPRS